MFDSVVSGGSMGGGGRADSTTGTTSGTGESASAGKPADTSLFGAPGGELAAAIEAAADPVSGLVPAGFLPSGGSTDPWAQVIHTVVAARRVQGWLLWVQLSSLDRWTAAWRARPPVSNAFGAADRCESADPDLTGRVNEEIIRIERQLGGRLAPMWGADPQLPVQLVTCLVGAELGLATGLSRTVSEQHVEAADALFTQGRLPRLARLLKAGWVDWPKVQAFVHATTGLDLVVAHAVERLVLGDTPYDSPDTLHDTPDGDAGDIPDASPFDSLAGDLDGDLEGEVDVLVDPARPGLGLPLITRMTLPQLRAAIEAAIAAIDAEAAAARAKAARSARRVRSRATGEGTATLSADVTVEAAAAVWNALTAAAKTARAAGDKRSLDQLRADILIARATTSPLAPPLPGDSPDAGNPADAFGDIHASGDPDDIARYADHAHHADLDPNQRANQHPDPEPMPSPSPSPSAASEERPTETVPNDLAEATGVACHACGQSPGQAKVRRAGAALTVNLTLPLAAYLRLSEDPGRLDGYGPVAAGLARQITDTARNHGAGLTGITWRCVVTDDTHGTVLGVGSPIRVARHDPPPRLADLVRVSEPTCCFPGCRTRARDCDLDHRIPYHPHDPTGERGGGPTCSCNLQPLCRSHHRLKTAGLIGIRRLSDAETATMPGVRAGTLEFTTSTGLRYLRAPSAAVPPPPDLDDPLIATALAHTGLQHARRAVDDARMTEQHATIFREQADGAQRSGTDPDEYDHEDRAWRASLAAARATTRRTRRRRRPDAAGTRDDEPPF